MTLYIDTASPDHLVVALRRDGKVIARRKVRAPRRQAERLLPSIEKLLADQGVSLSQLKDIVVADAGGSFTALRIGVITANALAYALGIKIKGESQPEAKTRKFGRFAIVEPIYDREPTIGRPKGRR